MRGPGEAAEYVRLSQTFTVPGSNTNPLATITYMKILVVGSGPASTRFAGSFRATPASRTWSAPPATLASLASLRPATSMRPTPTHCSLAERERVDLTVIGPEARSRGVADLFSARGRPIFGPRRVAAQLETSKAFAKEFMRRHRVPTARYRVCDSAEEALAAIRAREFGESLVVKADGLAAGKGWSWPIACRGGSGDPLSND